MEPLLGGIRALVTRPAEQAGALCRKIRAAGGEAWSLPLLAIEPLHDAALAPLELLAQQQVAIFASANAVRHAFARLHERGIAWPAGIETFAIGSATAVALAAAGIAAVAGATTMDSEELLREPRLQALAGRRIVLFKGAGGRALLAGQLRARGATLTECVLYVRRPSEVTPAVLDAGLAAHGINALLVASGETLQVLLGLLGAGTTGTINAQPVLVVPGSRVAGIANDAGIDQLEIAANATDGAMIEALARIAPRLRTRTETG